MKILLVNSNPVVSRLTALSARKESVKVDEIKEVSELKNSDYDIVFVDLESYSDELSDVLKKSNIQKKVLFYTQDDRENPEIFNLSILKPFLPSEVSAVLRETKIEMEEKADEAEEEYLDLNELIAEKKDDLAPMNLLKEEVVKKEEPKIEKESKPEIVLETKKELEKEIESKPEIALETKKELEKKIESKPKIEDKKENIEPINLIDTNNSEEKLLTELTKSKDKIDEIKESPTFKIEESLPPVIEMDKDESKLFELDTDDSSSDTNGLFELDKTNNLKDELLNFDLESENEVSFDITPKDESKKDTTPKDTSTKTLDKDEKIDEDIALGNITTTTAPQKDD
ncbi:hypothetical protein GSY74_10580, partial [Sulfurovum sp. bin170]|uniref:hypothetical protein n=1 Tax=Sulfurovum sp. bin170 TaxID=2695268 RepID=UPI001418ED8B